MTQTLIEQLEKLKLYWPGNRGEMYPAMTREGSRPRYVGANDLRAIIEQHKQEVSEPVCFAEQDNVNMIDYDDLSFSYPVSTKPTENRTVPLYANQHPDIIAELVKALEDDAYAATFQSMAGYRTALIAKVKGVNK